jgi:cytochrome P450
MTLGVADDDFLQRFDLPASAPEIQSQPNTGFFLSQNPLLHCSAASNPDFFQNPYPYYAALRAAGPVHHSSAFSDGAWLITRHADVDAVLRDHQRFRAQRTGSWVMQHEGLPADRLRGFQSLLARALLFVDEPDHPRLRMLMTPAFKQAALQEAQSSIKACVNHYLNALDRKLQTGAAVDWMSEVARPLPMQVVAMLMGIVQAPSHDSSETLLQDQKALAQMGHWCDDIAAFIGAVHASPAQTERAQSSVWALAGFLEPLIKARQKQPQNDWISLLTQAQAAGHIHNTSELLAQCVMLLFAGHETTRNLLGNGLHALLQNPLAWRQLRENPQQHLNTAVRELLRFDSPVQYTARRVAVDMRLQGQQLRRGDAVIALIASANHDPTRYIEPDQLKLHRSEGASLSFGAGPHACIGAALTLMEAQAVFSQVLQSWPGLRLTPEHTHQWHHNPVYRGLESLWVRII